MIVGFLTIRPAENGGLRGGYLLTSEYGRPLEFHYTAAIVVPPPQRVLYGDRFEPTLYGEVIGKALTDRQSRAPRVVVVNQLPTLELRRCIPAPVIYVEPAADDGEAATLSFDNRANIDALPAAPPLAVGDDTFATLPADSTDSAAGSDQNDAENARDDGLEDDEDEPALPMPPQPSFQVVTHPEFPQDLAAWEKLVTLLPPRFNWFEPFERLDLALAEIREPMAAAAAA